MRLIDADALIEAWGLQNCKKYGNETTEELSCSYATMSLYEVKDMIDDAPTVDAVSVVRCKEGRSMNYLDEHIRNALMGLDMLYREAYEEATNNALSRADRNRANRIACVTNNALTKLRNIKDER